MEWMTDAVRQAMLFGHLLFFAIAITTIIREDLALMSARRIDFDALHRTGLGVAMLLVALWITGLALIAMDGGLSAAVLAEKPKLAAKLTVVVVLTLNGVLLHWVAFPMMRRLKRDPRQVATICVALGAVSTTTWMFASFVGVARIIAPMMSYTSFMLLYLLGLAAALAVAWFVARGRLEKVLVQRAIRLHQRRLLARDESRDESVSAPPSRELARSPVRVPLRDSLFAR